MKENIPDDGVEIKAGYTRSELDAYQNSPAIKQTKRELYSDSLQYLAQLKKEAETPADTKRIEEFETKLEKLKERLLDE